MKKFTFIFEFEKGTYIKQVSSDKLQLSLLEWADSLMETEIPGMNDAVKRKIMLDVTKEPPTLIDGMDNV